jgi:hypothetical protein
MRGRAYKCGKCLFVEEKGRVVGHYYKHHVHLVNAPYYCLLCTFRCTTWEELEKHCSVYPPHNDKRKALASVDGNIKPDSEYLKCSPTPYFLEDTDLIKMSRADSKAEWERRFPKHATSGPRLSPANSGPRKSPTTSGPPLTSVPRLAPVTCGPRRTTATSAPATTEHRRAPAISASVATIPEYVPEYVPTPILNVPRSIFSTSSIMPRPLPGTTATINRQSSPSAVARTVTATVTRPSATVTRPDTLIPLSPGFSLPLLGAPLAMSSPGDLEDILPALLGHHDRTYSFQNNASAAVHFSPGPAGDNRPMTPRSTSSLSSASRSVEQAMSGNRLVIEGQQAAAEKITLAIRQNTATLMTLIEVVTNQTVLFQNAMTLRSPRREEAADRARGRSPRRRSRSPRPDQRERSYHRPNPRSKSQDSRQVYRR